MAYKIEKIVAGETALLVIDMQNDFLLPGAPLEKPEGRKIVPALQDLTATARRLGMTIVNITHEHRPDGSDMGIFKDLWPSLASGPGLIEGTHGAQTIDELKPQPGDLAVKKHRYSAFYCTDLEMLLRGRGITTVVISGVTSSGCCHATARDAMFRDFFVAFLSDGTATYDYPDTGFGAMSAEEVHRATLVTLSASLAHVMPIAELRSLVES